MSASPSVLVLWDHAADRPRGKTHALDCHVAAGLSDFVTGGKTRSGYERVPVARIPPSTGRCGFCGGGR